MRNVRLKTVSETGGPLEQAIFVPSRGGRLRSLHSHRVVISADEQGFRRLARIAPSPRQHLDGRSQQPPKRQTLCRYRQCRLSCTGYHLPAGVSSERTLAQPRGWTLCRCCVRSEAWHRSTSRTASGSRSRACSSCSPSATRARRGMPPDALPRPRSRAAPRLKEARTAPARHGRRRRARSRRRSRRRGTSVRRRRSS